MTVSDHADRHWRAEKLGQWGFVSWLHVPGDIAGHGHGRCAGKGGCGGGGDLHGIRFQVHLLVVVQLADDDAAEVLVVPVTVVQQLPHFSRARLLVFHKFVILPHQHGAGQQGIQTLVQAGFCHLRHNLLALCCNPLGNGALYVRRVGG